jgi:hypothetical protein
MVLELDLNPYILVSIIALGFLYTGFQVFKEMRKNGGGENCN